MSRPSWVLFLGLVAATACASGGVRQLTQQELTIMQRIEGRLDSNRVALHGALDDLGEIAATAIQDQHSLSLSIANAKLLESMSSPWTNPDSGLAATQREVALYHLYELEEAQRHLLEARLAERRASVAEVAGAYDALAALTRQAIQSQKILLAQLNQPADAQLQAFLTSLLAETRAFHETLALADDPALRALAHDVARAEEKLAKATETLSGLLQRFSTMRE
jgi:hypothetical protein